MGTIYVPTPLFPTSGISIDFTQEQLFKFKVNGLVYTNYQLVIRKISDNSIVYDSTKLTLNPNLYDQETLIHKITSSTITTIGNLKYTLQVWNGSETVTTREIPFYNYKTPILTFTVPEIITSKQYDFTATYVQDQNIPITKFKFVWLDESDNIIKDSDWIYSAKIKYTFNGFVNDTNYKIKCQVSNKYNITTEITCTFLATYSQPQLNLKPTATILENSGAIKIDWSQAFDNIGEVTGKYQFISNLSGDNHVLFLDSGSSIKYYIDTPENFTVLFMWIPIFKFKSGDIVELVNDSYSYRIFYDGKHFGFNNNSTEIYGLPKELNNGVYLIAVRSQDVIIIEYTFDESGINITNKEIVSWLKV